MSKSQLGTDSVYVKGFSWCPDGKAIGINALVAKNLCRDHNERLSPADKEAKRLLDSLKAINKRTEAWKAGTRQPRIVVELNAARIEQWFLKTTINMALQGLAHEGLLDAGEANEQLVRVAFGLSEFEEPHGLYWLVAQGRQVEGSAMGSLEWQSYLRREDRRVVAARLNFHGHQLWLSLPGSDSRTDVSRGTQVGFLETSCEIHLRWSKRRIRERRRLTGGS